MLELRMSLQSVMMALALVLVFMGPDPNMAAPPGKPDDEPFDLENYDLNNEMDWENLDVNVYGDSYDYDDLDQEVRGMEGMDSYHYSTSSKESRFIPFDLLPKTFS